MEPKGSLLCSQETSSGPYPEPDKSNPYHPIISLALHVLRVAANILNKQSRVADKGWASSLRFGRGACYESSQEASDLDRILG
jgi:hypothetical protein